MLIIHYLSLDSCFCPFHSLTAMNHVILLSVPLLIMSFHWAVTAIISDHYQVLCYVRASVGLKTTQFILIPGLTVSRRRFVWEVYIMPFDDFHFNNFHNGHKLMVKSYKVTSLQAKLWVCVTRLPPPAMFITPDMEAETPVRG